MNIHQPVRLTSLAHGGGCGCKLAPSVLQELLSGQAKGGPFERLLVGTETGDDAAVYDLDGTTTIIAHLLGREGERLCGTLRPDAPRGLDLYGYELVPRLYGPFLAYAFYRWEIVMRESAIVGILGVATLGFFIDSAIAEIRLDRALVLIAVTVLATAAIDFASRRIRARLALGAFGGVEAQRFPAR